MKGDEINAWRTWQSIYVLPYWSTWLDEVWFLSGLAGKEPYWTRTCCQLSCDRAVADSSGSGLLADHAGRRRTLSGLRWTGRYTLCFYTPGRNWPRCGSFRSVARPEAGTELSREPSQCSQDSDRPDQLPYQGVGEDRERRMKQKRDSLVETEEIKRTKTRLPLFGSWVRCS